MAQIDDAISLARQLLTSLEVIKGGGISGETPPGGGTTTPPPTTGGFVLPTNLMGRQVVTTTMPWVSGSRIFSASLVGSMVWRIKFRTGPTIPSITAPARLSGSEWQDQQTHRYSMLVRDRDNAVLMRRDQETYVSPTVTLKMASTAGRDTTMIDPNTDYSLLIWPRVNDGQRHNMFMDLYL